MKQGVKEMPLGVSNFVTVREQNLYYVDKTMYLPMLEDEARNLFCIRPRRFGKSLLLSMLRAYYDVKMQDKFQSLFGDLWIGSHPTRWRGQYQMLGFSTEDVREMFRYYKEAGVVRSDCDVETVIEEMKPWYDNYCFSKAAFDTQSKVFNCNMVLYYLRNYAETGEAPEEMIDPNTKTDYNKMHKLLQLDKLDGDRKGVLMEIAEKGEILGTIKETFPASELTDPDTFVSLLFYYGMLTIKGVQGDRLLLGIPNNNVRKQYYEYLLEIY